MKRDLDRSRQILLNCEKSKKRRFELGRATSEFDLYQIEKMAEAGFVEIDDPSKGSRIVGPGVALHGAASFLEPKTFQITWAGHDYLDAIRDDENWRKTKAGLEKIGGGTFEIAKELAVAYIKQSAKEKLGITL